MSHWWIVVLNGHGFATRGASTANAGSDILLLLGEKRNSTSARGALHRLSLTGLWIDRRVLRQLRGFKLKGMLTTRAAKSRARVFQQLVGDFIAGLAFGTLNDHISRPDSIHCMICKRIRISR
jgi:hypothetical protein